MRSTVIFPGSEFFNLRLRGSNRPHQCIRHSTGHSAPLGAREVAAACFSTLVTSRFGERSISPERLSLIHKISNCQTESHCIGQVWQWSGRGRAKKSIERAGRKRIPFMVGFSLQPALLVAGLTNELSETGGGRQRKAGTTCREGQSRAANCRSSEERPELLPGRPQVLPAQ